jgi:hypothetical protein
VGPELDEDEDFILCEPEKWVGNKKCAAVVSVKV